MLPWKISFGLTITLAALGVPLGMERLVFLRPYMPLIRDR